MTEYDVEEMNEIGRKIRNVISELEELSDEEITKFANYVSHQETVQPMMDPTAYRDDGVEQKLEMAGRRVLAVRKAFDELKPEDFAVERLVKNADGLEDRFMARKALVNIGDEEFEAEIKDVSLEVSDPEVIEEVRKGDRTEFSVQLELEEPDEEGNK